MDAESLCTCSTAKNFCDAVDPNPCENASESESTTTEECEEGFKLLDVQLNFHGDPTTVSWILIWDDGNYFADGGGYITDYWEASGCIPLDVAWLHILDPSMQGQTEYTVKVDGAIIRDGSKLDT